MKTICFLNVKGGVAKSTSAICFSYILAHEYGKRVLLCDFDHQANTTGAMGVYDTERLSIADLLTDSQLDIRDVIRETKYPNIHVIPSNLALIQTNKEILLDMEADQIHRFANHMKAVQNDYDYCIIDCFIDLNMATLNALAYADDVLVPIKIDAWSFNGLEYLLENVEAMKDYNSKLQFAGAFVTMYQKNNLNKQGEAYLSEILGDKFFKTHIRHTVKVTESTYEKPLMEYAKKSTAAQDYRDLVKEYLEKRGNQ